MRLERKHFRRRLGDSWRSRPASEIRTTPTFACRLCTAWGPEVRYRFRTLRRLGGLHRTGLPRDRRAKPPFQGGSRKPTTPPPLKPTGTRPDWEETHCLRNPRTEGLWLSQPEVKEGRIRFCREMHWWRNFSEGATELGGRAKKVRSRQEQSKEPEEMPRSEHGWSMCSKGSRGRRKATRGRHPAPRAIISDLRRPWTFILREDATRWP